MVRKKQVLLSFLFMASFLLAMGLASADGDMVTPADSATISGTAVLNASGVELLNCTFYAKSTLTANSSWSTLSTDTNETASATSINGTFDSTILEDANNYIFNATCYNSSDDLVDGTTNIGVIVDNTVPQTPSSLSPSDSTEIKTTTTQTFSGTVTDANTTSCTYTIARGGASSGLDYESGSGTYSASTCSFTKTFDGSEDNGIWYWNLIASDETNTSTSSMYQVVANFPGSGGGYLPLEVAGTGDGVESSTLYWIIGIIIAVILIAVAIYFTSMKK